MAIARENEESQPGVSRAAAHSFGSFDRAVRSPHICHSQIDASLSYNFTNAVQIPLQALNLNTAVFGFFNGTPKQDYGIQREYYGRTFHLEAKYGL